MGLVVDTSALVYRERVGSQWGGLLAQLDEPVVLPAIVYAELLADHIRRDSPQVYLVNTGWTGGAYGVGHRIPIEYTRAMLRAAFSGALDGVQYRQDGHFGLRVPVDCPGVPQELLDPRATWADASAFDRKAAELASMFEERASRLAERA